MKCLNKINVTGKFSPSIIAGAIALFLASASATAGPDTLGSIDVEAQGVVYSTADLAGITVGVETQSENASDAVEENAKIVKKLHEVMDDFDVDEKNRATQNYALNQEFNYQVEPNQSPQLVGYRVTHQLSIEQLPINKLGELIDALSKEGSSQIMSIRFRSSEEDKLIAQARKLAVKNAIEKARAIANAADVDLDRIVNITELSQVASAYQAKSVAMSQASFDGESTYVSQGELAHQVSVSLRYSIDD